MKVSKNSNCWIKYNPKVEKIVSETSRKFKIFSEDQLLTDLLTQHTENFGSVNKIKVNKYEKEVFVNQGVIVSSIRDLSAYYKINKDKCRLFINELIEKGVLIKVKLLGNQIRYAWNYIYSTIKNKRNESKINSENNLKNNSEEKAKKSKEKQVQYKLETADLQRIGEKLKEKGIVIQRISVQAKSDATNYINIKDKEEYKKDINTTSSNRAREEIISTDNLAVDFDFSYGENEKVENQSVRDSSFSSLASDFKNQTEQIAAKIQAAFTPAYQKQVKPAQNRIKPIAKFQENKEDPEETKLKAAKDSLKDKLSAPEMIDLMRLGINRSKDWVKTFLFGTGQNVEPERIKKQLMEMRNEGIL